MDVWRGYFQFPPWFWVWIFYTNRSVNGNIPTRYFVKLCLIINLCLIRGVQFIVRINLAM